jgi:dihydroorotase
LVVHVGRDVPPYPRDVLGLLRPGDIITHVYCGGPHGLIAENGGAVDPEIAARLKSGIIVDVGHGFGSLTFSAVANGLRRGIVPDTISSDLHTESVKGPVFDLVTTMSKFLTLGMDLVSVIAATTCNPARALRLNSVSGEGPGNLSGIGTLTVGSPADVSVLSLKKGRFAFYDCVGAGITGDRLLEPEFVLRRGELIPAQKVERG